MGYHWNRMLPWPNPPIENVAAGLKHISPEVSLITGNSTQGHTASTQHCTVTVTCGRQLVTFLGNSSLSPWTLFPTQISPRLPRQLISCKSWDFYISLVFRVCLGTKAPFISHCMLNLKERSLCSRRGLRKLQRRSLTSKNHFNIILKLL